VKIAFSSSGKKHQYVQGMVNWSSPFSKEVFLIIPQGAVYFLPASTGIFYTGIRGATNRVVTGKVRSFKIASPFTNQETPKEIMAQASSQKIGL